MLTLRTTRTRQEASSRPRAVDLGGRKDFSYFTNANQFAGYLAMLLPFLAVIFFETAGRWNRLLWAYCFVGTR